MKIRRKKHHSVPSLNMASMPDLIFTVLFFFMIVTHMRTETPKMHIETPEGTELTKAARKRSILNLYIGTDAKGISRIQIGNNIVPLNKVGTIVLSQKNKLNDEDAELFTINIRADKQTPMGIITDVKQEIRKVGALNIRYSATEK
ncbi:MAG: biopolymer transporter ExbD [Prevotella sp.]|nr:biopolymer transporter ExbD [Candidatus Prevotella equi]